MPFAGNYIAGFEVMHISADPLHLSNKLMPCMHGHGDCLFRPFIPLIDVHIGAADCGPVYFYQDIVYANIGQGNLIKPEARFSFGLHEGLHHIHINTLP